LYFINPKNEEKNKMPQIWTQGETEASSVWFPTIDAPNVKTKQEIYITVDNKYQTLSNGKLVSSTKNANGTRTDYWKQELPHAPYLFMMGVGEFKVAKDSYKRPDGTTMDVHYYVEPEWEPYAKAIFGETPKMIGYFSQLLGVEYPWDKYHQIVVRDYVSGAMENTGAVVFGDYVYKNDRELLDANDQSTIAHELFHHWFGDLVTCESWSNLSLNESFANYSQYLWDEYRYGLDEAEYQAIGEADGYYASAQQQGYHDLIWFDYPDKEAMFDGHSYNKGGRILHMLRSYIGDEAFFAALQSYLKTNAYKPAEFHQLRIAFEEVCGEDLNWFFDQWYLDSGHPSLTVSYDYLPEENTVYLNVDQTQTDFRLFKLPVDVTMIDERGATTQRVWINERSNRIALQVKGTLKNVVFDSKAQLLAKISETKPEAWYIDQYYNGPKHYIQRKQALQFGLKSRTPESEKLVLDALNDPFWDIRSTAVERVGRLSADNKTKAIEQLKKMVTSDSVSSVRASIVNVLSTLLSAADVTPILDERIQNDRSYSVVSNALNNLAKINPDKAMAAAKKLESEKSSRMLGSIAALYAKTGKPESYGFYVTALESGYIQGFDKIGTLNAFTFYLSKQEVSMQQQALEIYKREFASGGMYVKMFAPQYITYLKNSLGDRISKLQDEENKAKEAGNTNAADIARGKRIEAEALQLEYEKLMSTLNE
jgi:aminopeptidase N